MKQLTKLMTRLRRRKPRRQDKHGSSMALVMIITSALVIWVMCLAPLMSTTGTTALKVQNGYTDYLSSRSAIEYAKSELEFIVRSGSPYTFAVIEKNDGTYDTVAKTASNYSSYVTSQDEPNMNVLGSDVAAISTVIGPDNSGRYEILIKSYNNGEKGLSFRVKFQETGSLMIVPEVYEQTAALPINDFVLVDGKLGQNVVWKSNIDYDRASGGMSDLLTYKGYVRYNSANNRYTTNDIYHVEMLKPWKLNYEADTPYANSGEYPAVFKATAQSATGTLNIGGTPLVEQQYSKEDWILPFSPLEEGGSNNDVGAVWIKLYNNSNCYQVFLKTKTSEKNITSKCTLYVNGTSVKPTNSNNPYFDVSKLITTAYSAYRITVDYAGSDPNNKYNTDENALNALGRNGMIVKEFAGDMTAIKNEAVSIEPRLKVSMSNDGSTMTVTVIDVDVKEYPDAQFYSTATGAWQHSNQFIIDNFSEIHYFYAYVPSRMENGAITPDSGVKYAGAVAGFGSAVSMEKLENDKQYWIMNGIKQKNSSTINLDVAMKNDNGLGAQKFITEGTTANGGYVHFDTNTNSDNYKVKWDTFKWMADKDKGYIYQGSQYLNLSATLSNPSNPTSNSAFSWSYSVSLKEGENAVTLSESNNGFSIYESFSETRTLYKWQSGGCSGGSYVEDRPTTLETKSYLNISGSNNNSSTGSISASDKETAVYFVEVPKWTNNPSMPDAPPPDDAGRQVTDDFSLSNWDELFANGASIQSVNELGPGNYILTGFSDTHYLVCEYSVGKTNQTGSISVDYVANPNDECTVTITGTSGNGKSGGVRYIGYKELKENEETTYHWFPTADKDGTYSTTITIPHGKYEFMFKESGNSNYNSQEVLYQDPTTKEYVATIDYMYVEFAEDAFQSVTWTYKDGVETFYLPLPDGVTYGRLKPVFGTPGASGQSNDISWSINPSRETRYYGVIVENSNFEEIPNVLQLPQPLPLTNNNGHTSSLIRGKSVYLMNERASINTYNNVIYIDTDLLVLNSSIVSTSADGLRFDANNEIDANNTAFLTPDDASFEARVLVKPYSKGRLPNGEPRQVLLFAAENIVNSDRKTIVFEKNCYYLIPANTDIYNLNPSTAADYKVGCYAPGQEANNMQSVANLFSNRYYPEINYDIAFATSTQLNQVISGETVGWTDDGKLLGGSDKYNFFGIPVSILNENFAVAAYITSQGSGSVNRNANRVLLAAPSTLEVTDDVRFTTRYLSIDAPVVNGTNRNVEFIIDNMGEHDSFFEGIGKYFTSLFGYKINYSSKTLQIDFEQKTKITLDGAEVNTYDPQICRYSNGANLFANQPLMSIMVPYTAKEIMDLNPKADNSGIMIVDRYIELSADSAQPSLTLAQAKTMNVNVYSNYIHITNSVSAIDITTNQKTGKSGFILNSQEYGYSSNEYMGLFIVPAGEAFSGTLLRIDGYGNTGKLQVMADGFDSPKPIPRGFYFVPATDEGTPISAIAQAIEANDGDPTKTAYWVSEDKLREYAVIIDNESSSTYVDTGLWGSGGTGAFSNFYGGTVE